jgi:3'-5' exonuclease
MATRLLDRTLLAFDIETIPDPALGRRLLGLEGDDRAVVAEMVRRRRQETNGGSDYPQLPWHRVVSLCGTVLDPASGAVAIRSFGKEALDERSHLEGFYGFIAEEVTRTGVAPRLVSWNGSGFDLPVLRYRAMALGVAAPAFYGAGLEGAAAEERRANGYEGRYHDLHVDVMDVLSGYGASSRVGLGTISQVLGLPGKQFLERAIHEHVLDGEAARVEEYCKLDTVQTMLVFLAWAHHRGDASSEAFARCTAGVRRAVGEMPYEGWRGIEGALEGWGRSTSY